MLPQIFPKADVIGKLGNPGAQTTLIDPAYILPTQEAASATENIGKYACVLLYLYYDGLCSSYANNLMTRGTMTVQNIMFFR